MNLVRKILVSIGLAVAAEGVTKAGVINVTTNDSYAKIEGALAGDEVIVAPGIYRFRVHLTAKGTAGSPINIHALDPNNKPVWDLSATLVEDAPGSYTAGDRGRGGWQVDGGTFYRISGIVFTGCRTASQNAGGIRYYNGTTGLYLKDCLFRDNDNGLTGGTQGSDATVEFCEFDGNGSATASSPTHNMYIYGGTFTLRYCYVHDSLQAENFHIRAQTATLEYNWFARAANYEGDLMTDDDFAGAGPFTQTMLLRGNVFLQNTNPGNRGQVLVIFNDTGLANENMSMRVINNTYVGNGIPGGGGAAAFVHLSNAGTNNTQMSAEVSNDLIFGTTKPVLIENVTNGVVTGANNWLATGVSPGSLTNSVFSALPGFRNAAGKDFTLATNSAAIGGADESAIGLPSGEYYRDETVAREYRVRATAKDIGAFESTTGGAGIGPYDAPPAPKLGAATSGRNVVISWPVGAEGFALEQTGALGISNSWTQAPGPYVTNATNVVVSAPVSASNGFFRLRKGF